MRVVVCQCMSASVHACPYVHVNACVSTCARHCMCVRMCASMRVCKHVRVNACMSACPRQCVGVRLSASMHRFTCGCQCVCARMCASVYVFSCARQCLCVFMCASIMCVCLHVTSWWWSRSKSVSCPDSRSTTRKHHKFFACQQLKRRE